MAFTICYFLFQNSRKHSQGCLVKNLSLVGGTPSSCYWMWVFLSQIFSLSCISSFLWKVSARKQANNWYWEEHNCQLKEKNGNMPKKSCDCDPVLPPLFFDCLNKQIPVITDIISTSLISGVVPQCFQQALVKPLLKKTLNLWKTTTQCQICCFCWRFSSMFFFFNWWPISRLTTSLSCFIWPPGSVRVQRSHKTKSTENFKHEFLIKWYNNRF